MIHSMSEEQKNKRKVVQVKGVGRMKNYDFLLELFEAFEAGYRPAPKEGLHTADIAVFKNNRKTAVLYPEGYEVPTAGTYQEPAKSDAEVIAESNAEILAEIESEKEQEPEEKVVVDEPESTPAVDDTPTPEAEVKEEAEKEEPSVKEQIESLSKKAELLDLAKDLDFVVPADKAKNPAQIKKFLLESIKPVKE